MDLIFYKMSHSTATAHKFFSELHVAFCKVQCILEQKAKSKPNKNKICETFLVFYQISMEESTGEST
jgi:hypothetical protein